jgi:hypothetical protein
MISSSTKRKYEEVAVASKNTIIPPKSWKRMAIKYAELVLLHPTSKGICHDNGYIKSVQMVVPNSRYDDCWCFDDNRLNYKQSDLDMRGNEALYTAYKYDFKFKLYVRYKKETKDQTNLDIPKDMKGKSFDLGYVHIVDKKEKTYVLEPVPNRCIVPVFQKNDY